MKRMLSVGTLNVTTLKLKGEDEFSVRKCGHLYEVINFMDTKGIHILAYRKRGTDFLLPKSWMYSTVKCATGIRIIT